MNKVVLASPLHDPKGVLLESIHKNGEALRKIFDKKIAINVTKATSQEIFDALSKIGLPYEISESGGNIGDDYRAALKKALEFDFSMIQLLDFDRALHWVERYPEELAEILEKLSNMSGFVSFVRSRRAFETHPITQRSTETAVNAIASEVAGFGVDIMSGSFGFEKTLVEKILEQSSRNDFGFYAEPLVIAKRNDFHISILEVDGLEWETPDQYKSEIEEYGYSGWLNKFESLTEWEKRVKLLDETAQTLTS